MHDRRVVLFYTHEARPAIGASRSGPRCGARAMVPERADTELRRQHTPPDAGSSSARGWPCHLLSNLHRRLPHFPGTTPNLVPFLALLRWPLSWRSASRPLPSSCTTLWRYKRIACNALPICDLVSPPRCVSLRIRRAVPTCRQSAPIDVSVSLTDNGHPMRRGFRSRFRPIRWPYTKSVGGIEPQNRRATEQRNRYARSLQAEYGER